MTAESIKAYYFPRAVQAEVFDALCGDFLGEGSARDVFEFRHDPTKVVKIETKSKSFQNVMEWDIWEWVRGHPLKKWFAPCHFLGGNGIVLIQSRTDPLPAKYRLPKRVPAILGDLKRENFGLLDGRLVAHDYGTANVSLQQAAGVRASASRLVSCVWSA